MRDPESLRGLVERLHEGIYVTNREGEILDANPAFLNMLGIASLDDLNKHKVADLIVGASARAAELAQLDKEGSVRDYELRIRRLNGEIRTVIDSAVAVRDPQTGETVYQGILVDITERKQLEAQLLEQSIRDPLTGSFNRRYLTEFEKGCNERQQTWGCIMLDIDHFKEYNDQFGHHVGDEVLVRISRFLMRQTRAEEGVVRLGGDEFCVLLGGADDKVTARTTDRLKQAGARELPISFSLGWACREGKERLESTINRADEKLLNVRSLDRNGEERRRP